MWLIINLPKCVKNSGRAKYWSMSAHSLNFYTFYFLLIALKWWLKRTHAPLEKRNEVYKTLHDRYCEPALDLILHLKGMLAERLSLTHSIISEESL